MAEEIRVYGIHSLDDNLFLKKNVIAISWHEFGDLAAVEPTREAFKARYQVIYPDAKPGSIPGSSGMLYRFCHEIQIGDYIVFPSKIDKMINIGIVESPYIYDQAEPEYVHKRKVKWLKHIPRKSFTQGALHEVGSALTLFAVKNYPDEFLSALDSGFTKNEKPDDTVGATAEEIKQSTRDFILKELSHHLKGYDFEKFVANLMEAMGYRTEVSAQGGDSGIDIKAYKDELPPRIVAQVKSQDSDIKETTIQSLKGAMMPGDYGVFITLSSFTKNAKKYLDANPIIRGIDGDGLVDLILKYYDKLDEKYHDIIPLEKVYIPVNKSV